MNKRDDNEQIYEHIKSEILAKEIIDINEIIDETNEGIVTIVLIVLKKKMQMKIMLLIKMSV